MDTKPGVRAIGKRQAIAMGVAVAVIAGLVTLASIGGGKSGRDSSRKALSTAETLPDGATTTLSVSPTDSVVSGASGASGHGATSGPGKAATTTKSGPGA